MARLRLGIWGWALLVLALVAGLAARVLYIFGDHVSGRLWSLELPVQRDTAGKGELLGRFPHAYSAFARDANGELYALDFTRGLILRLLAA